MDHLIILSMQETAQKIRDYIDQALQLLNGNGLTDVLIQLGATLLLFLAVRFLLWNKVTDIIEKRKASFENAMKEKKDALAKAKEIEIENEKKILDARKESAEIIELAKDRSYKEAEKIIDEAKVEADSIINKAHSDVEAAYNQAQEDIKKEIIDVAFMMASKITEKEINESEHQDLVDSFMKDVKKNG